MLQTSAFCDIVRQSERSGSKRCAAVLYTDRFPKTLSKPHHLGLARRALDGLASADKAQVFNLARGRIAVVWRAGDGQELEVARSCLDHLLSGQPAMMPNSTLALLSGYELPREATRLLDEVAADTVPCGPNSGRREIDVTLLARLEASLAVADLTCFARARPVVAFRKLGALETMTTPAWDERYFDIEQLAAELSPGRDLRAEPRLFGRFTRTLDTRMLALLAMPEELMRCGPFAIKVNATTILSPAFLRLDGVLPTHLRGEVILILRAADILADATQCALARHFARARGYRLGLADVTPRLIELLDITAADIELLHVPLTPALRESDGQWLQQLPSGSEVILTGIDRPSDLRWAAERGFHFGSGAMFRSTPAQAAAARR